MSSLICPHDKIENPVHALVCAQCGEKLSAAQTGIVFADAYRIVAPLGEDDAGFRYRIEEVSTNIGRILREIVPSQPGSREQLVSFGQAAQRLIQARPRSLVATVAYFTQGLLTRDLRYYVVEELPPPAPTLQELLQDKQRLNEDEGRGFFHRLLAGLEEMYSLDPPVYLGSVNAGTVLVSGDGQPVFLESRYLSDKALGMPAPTSQEAFGKDIDGCARLVMAALAGKIAPRPENMTFGCTLDWLLDSGSKRPRSAAEVGQFWKWIESALAANQSSNPAKAVEYLERAFGLSGSHLVEEALRKAEKAQAAQAMNATEPTPATELVKKTYPEAPQSESLNELPPGQPASILAKPHTQAKPIQAARTVETRSPDTKPLSPPGQPAAALSTVQMKKPAVKPGQPKAPNLSKRSVSQAKSSQSRAHSNPKSAKRFMWISGPLLILSISCALGAWLWNTNRSLKRSFDFAVANGHLLAPPGENAYELYQKAVQSDSNSERVKQMGETVRPILQQYMDKQFSRWHEDFDLPSDQRADLAKAVNWLLTINPNDTTSRGRKEYLDAQTLYSQGKYPDALTGFQKALQRVPNWDLANMGLGDSFMALKRYYHAENYYKLAKASSPGWSWPERKLEEVRPFLSASDSKPVITSPHPVATKQVEIKGPKNVASAKQHRNVEDSSPADRPFHSDSFKYTVRPTKIGSTEPCTVWLVEWTASGATTSWIESDSGRVQDRAPGSVVLRHPGRYEVKTSGPGGTSSHPFTISATSGVKPCS